MRDFDEGKAELEFKLGGEEFVARRVRPEVLATFQTDETTTDATMAITLLDERISAFLANDEDRARYAALRCREEDPVTVGQLNALLEWMLEVSSDLPTTLPSPSAVLPGGTAASSKGRSR
jgi:hypothetical protein